MSSSWGALLEDAPILPDITDKEPFSELICKLTLYFQDAVQTSFSFEDMKTAPRSKLLSPLIWHLVEKVQHRGILPALLALKSHFNAVETDDDSGINETRAYACEYVAWRLVTHLSEREAIESLLTELPIIPRSNGRIPDEEALILDPSLDESNGLGIHSAVSDTTPLVGNPANIDANVTSEDPTGSTMNDSDPLATTGGEEADAFAASFDSLNALEIAAVTGSKKFLSQRVIQKILERIWEGDIVFWETLGVNSIKEAKIYNKKKADPFCRLRVPKYLKFFEVMFFISFLVLYYAVLVPVQRNGRGPSKKQPPFMPQYSFGVLPTELSQDPSKSFRSISPIEVLLYIWIASFAYDEFGEYRDAGSAFYATDFWSVVDLGTVAIGLAFFITRMIGLSRRSDDIISISFDILSLEALFLVPRTFSLLSLNPYFGTLIPCLREMTKDFIKFLSLVAILYLGFLTTFTMLARDDFTLSEMSWVLIKVFFGSSYLGFDIAQQISPLLGPPLMLIFVCMTNILLITSLISLLSNSLAKILEHAREEYLFIYSVYVLEASTSNRLTYYLPPLNLIPLFLRPLRLLVSTERLRRARILMLKITHSPFVVAIWAYEGIHDRIKFSSANRGSGKSSLVGPSSTLQKKRYSRVLMPTPRMLPAASLSQALLDGVYPATGVSSRNVPRPLSEGQDDLRSLVLKLTSRLDRLTALVAAQQQDKEPQGAQFN